MVGWEIWLDKKVYVILKDGRRYEGHVILVDDSTGVVFLTIKDKYDFRVLFAASEIHLIKEEDEQEKLK